MNINSLVRKLNGNEQFERLVKRIANGKRRNNINSAKEGISRTSSNASSYNKMIENQAFTKLYHGDEKTNFTPEEKNAIDKKYANYYKKRLVVNNTPQIKEEDLIKNLKNVYKRKNNKSLSLKNRANAEIKMRQLVSKYPILSKHLNNLNANKSYIPYYGQVRNVSKSVGNTGNKVIKFFNNPNSRFRTEIDRYIKSYNRDSKNKHLANALRKHRENYVKTGSTLVRGPVRNQFIQSAFNTTRKFYSENPPTQGINNTKTVQTGNSRLTRFVKALNPFRGSKQ